MPTNIIVDGNNVGMAAHYATEQLRDIDGRPVGAIFGFIRMLRAIVENVQLINCADPKTNIFVAWDAPRSTLWRKQFFDGYKAGREEAKDAETEQSLKDYHDQVPRLRELLTLMGVIQIRAAGYEADDIAGWFAHKKGDQSYVMVTGDEDWLQLVTPNIKVWQPSKKRFVGMENFAEVTGCQSPEQFVIAKAIIGDPGDDIPGCKGVGIKTAAKFLAGDLKKGVKFEAIKAWIENPDGFRRSYSLVELRKMEIDSTSFQLTPGSLNPQAFMDQCIGYGFNSILADINSWLLPFTFKMPADT